MRHFCGVLQAFTAFPEIKFVSSARSELDYQALIPYEPLIKRV